MKRTAISAIWLGSVAVAYLAGKHGESLIPVDPEQERAPSIVLQEISVETSSGNPQGTIASSDRVARARQLAESGELERAVSVLEEYLLIDAHDPEALFLLSDLLQMTGRTDRALEPLLGIIRYPLVPADAENGRRRLNLLINAREQQLINAADSAGLVSFFERLAAAEPGYDGHRLKLSRWLLRSGEVDAAAEVLREVGYTGVTDAERTALERELELARNRLPVERVDGGLYMAASIRGTGRAAEYRLLIDTGATMTGLRISVLKALRATPLNETRRVHTANGLTTLPVYRISEMHLAGVAVNDLAVLGLSDLPPAVDGLLGLDVLDRLSGQAAGVVGMPGDPR
jgi:predicted aspartyl protease